MQLSNQCQREVVRSLNGHPTDRSDINAILALQFFIILVTSKQLQTCYDTFPRSRPHDYERQIEPRVNLRDEW